MLVASDDTDTLMQIDRAAETMYGKHISIPVHFCDLVHGTRFRSLIGTPMQHLTAPPPLHDRAISLDAISILTWILGHDAQTLRSKSHCDEHTRVRLLFSVATPCSRKAIVFAESSQFYIGLLMIGSAR